MQTKQKEVSARKWGWTDPVELLFTSKQIFFLLNLLSLSLYLHYSIPYRTCSRVFLMLFSGVFFAFSSSDLALSIFSPRPVFFLHKKSGPAPALVQHFMPVYYLEAIRHDPLAPGLSASLYRHPAHYTGSLQMSPNPGHGKKSDRLTGSCVKKHDRDSAYQRRVTCFYPRSVLYPLAGSQNMVPVPKGLNL